MQNEVPLVLVLVHPGPVKPHVMPSSMLLPPCIRPMMAPPQLPTEPPLAMIVFVIVITLGDVMELKMPLPELVAVFPAMLLLVMVTLLLGLPL